MPKYKQNPYTKTDKKFETIVGLENFYQEAEERGIRIHRTFDKASWYSEDVTINGEHPQDVFHEITTVSFRNKSTAIKMWKGISEAIEGLHCPFCRSQAFKTDKLGVAVCGAAPMWFFFYRSVEKERNTKLQIVNGELKETESEVDVS